MSKHILPLLAGIALLAAAGCQHDYDGTVLIPKPLDFRQFWQRTPMRAEGPRRSGGNLFPVAPARAPYAAQGPGSNIAKRQLTKKPAVTDISSDGTASPLTCRNVSEPGKRVHVVCE